MCEIESHKISANMNTSGSGVLSVINGCPSIWIIRMLNIVVLLQFYGYGVFVVFCFWFVFVVFISSFSFVFSFPLCMAIRSPLASFAYVLWKPNRKKNSSTISISLQDSGVDKVLDMIVKQFLMKLCASFGFRVMQTNRNNITYERWQYVNVFFYHLLAQ